MFFVGNLIKLYRGEGRDRQRDRDREMKTERY